MQNIKMPLFTFLTLFFTISMTNLYAVNITDYQPIFIPTYDANYNLNIAIRMYTANNSLHFLCIDPNTLQTKILPSNQAKFRGNHQTTTNNYFSMQLLTNTPYMKLLHKFSQPPYLIQNYGIIQASNNLKGIFLTIDMCPSTKPFEKKFFSTLSSLANQLHRPFPVAISISGLWIIEHPQEFKWLLEQQVTNKLAITWINHSFSHPYYPDLPLENNFLLFNTKYFEQEVLATEKLLLEYGQKPSIYFRFPGLVANKELVVRLKNLGLIAIGSNAWLAKNERPQNGSFILVHGNGNEAHGIIDKFLPTLKNSAATFLHLDQGALAAIQ